MDFLSDVLIRAHSTVPQTEQPTAVARQRSLAGAFEVGSDKTGSAAGGIVGRRILVVDDVFTTGSTAKSCASALKSAGASWVGVAALAVQPIGGLK